MSQPPSFIVIICFVLFALTVHSQTKSVVNLKTNAKDTLTISRMYTTGDGVGEGIRVYKIIGKNYAYDKIEIDLKPQFPGGENKFRDTIYKRAEALYPETQGTMNIQFVIGYDGKLTDIRFTGSEHPGIDRRLTKFIKSLPKWTSAIKDNKYVRVRSDFQYK